MARGCIDSDDGRYNSSCTSTRVYKINQLVYVHLTFKNDPSLDQDSSKKLRTTVNSHTTLASSETAR